ncbi:MAG: DNA cytosine methyltransferase [candidate division Zixibacteria bacterium]|nr:DNA cytosine methyltransferase [candidate division Zixibacteria bacterium]
MRKRFIAVDLFSGCGGLTLGLTKAGFKVRAAVEIDPAASSVFRLNHRRVKMFTDIRKVKGRDILKKLCINKGGVDLLAGCPPCQGFSRLRTKNKNKRAFDSRNRLIVDFLRLVEETKPKTVMLENVPGLLRHWRFNVFKKSLKELGYKLDYKIVNASDYGVPQRRKRLLLMASLLGPVDIPNVVYQRKTVADAIRELPVPSKSRKPLHKLLPKHSKEVTQRIAKVPKNGGSRIDLGLENQLACHTKDQFNGFKDIYGRMKWDDVAPTLTRFCSNPSKGRFLHPKQNRVISPYEAALLQSFPKSYNFPTELGRNAICSMIGEAFPPLMAQRQAKYFYQHIKNHE